MPRLTYRVIEFTPRVDGDRVANILTFARLEDFVTPDALPDAPEFLEVDFGDEFNIPQQMMMRGQIVRVWVGE